MEQNQWNPDVISSVCPSNTNLYAESKPQYDSHSFIWRIKNFLTAIQSHPTKLISPVFEENPDQSHKWMIRVIMRPKTDVEGTFNYIGFQLYLAQLSCNVDFQARQNGLPVLLHFSVLDLKGNQLKEPIMGRSNFFFKERNGWGVDNFLTLEALQTDESNLICDGDLILKCHILTNFHIEHRVGLDSTPSTADPRQQSSSRGLKCSMLSLLDDPAHSDLVIEVGSASFHVHKAILAARCSVFEDIFSSTKTEKIPGLRMWISDFDPEVVKAMLEYIYCGEPQNKEMIIKKPSEMLKIGKKYKLSLFVDLCEDLLVQSISIENAMDILVAADCTDLQNLKEVAVNFINWHKASVVETEGFRKAAKNMPQVFQHLYLAEH